MFRRTWKGAGSSGISCTTVYVIHGFCSIRYASWWVIKVSSTNSPQLELVDIQMDKNGDSLELQTSSSDILDKTIPEQDAQKQKIQRKKCK